MKSHQAKWMRILGALLMAISILSPAPKSGAAQAQEPQKSASELEQLKDRLQQLEKVMQEIKGQINGMEQAQKPGGSGTPAPTQASASASVEQKGKSSAPKAIEAVYSTKADPPADPATAVASPRRQDDKKGENTFQIYGFAMLDAGFQFRQSDPDWFDVMRPSKLPSFGDQFAPDGKVFLGVRQSRLGVKGTTATKYGELKTTFEFELFGVGSNVGETTFRLRHAYGELGHFGAGQYWSVFVDVDSFPNTVEYWGPNGLVWFRNVQFRWMPLKGKNALTIGIERPGASGDQGRVADRNELQGIRAKFDLPDLTANARFTRDWGHVQIGGLLKRVKWVDTLDDGFDLGGSDVGWGIAVSAVPKFNKNNVGRFQFIYGEAIQNYLNDAPVDVAIERTNSSDPRRPIKGVSLPAFAMSAYLDHTWSKRFSSALGYSVVNIENTEGQADNAYHRGHYASTNLLFYPVDNAMVGAEFIWGKRENFRDGFSPDDARLQFVFKYNFSKLFTNFDK